MMKPKVFLRKSFLSSSPSPSLHLFNHQSNFSNSIPSIPSSSLLSSSLSSSLSCFQKKFKSSSSSSREKTENFNPVKNNDGKPPNTFGYLLKSIWKQAKKPSQPNDSSFDISDEYTNVVGIKSQKEETKLEGLKDNAFRRQVVKSQKRIQYDTETLPLRMTRIAVNNNFKLLKAGETLIPVSHALQMEELPHVYNLDGEKVNLVEEVSKYNATFLFISFIAYSDTYSHEWIDPFVEKFHKNMNVSNTSIQDIDPQKSKDTNNPVVLSGNEKYLKKGDPEINYLYLSITEGMVYRLLKNTITKNIKSTFPPEHSKHRLQCFITDSYAFKSSLNIYNTKVGYALLIDKKGRLRWVATGQPEQKELETLYKVTEQLNNKAKK